MTSQSIMRKSRLEEQILANHLTSGDDLVRFNVSSSLFEIVIIIKIFVQ